MMEQGRLVGVLCVLISTTALVINFVAVPLILQRVANFQADLQANLLIFKGKSDSAWDNMMSVRTMAVQSLHRTGRQVYATSDTSTATLHQCPNGPTGQPGDPGQNGREGQNGRNGPPGIDADQLANTGDEFCYPCPAGPIGRPGGTGPRGELGQSGSGGEPGIPGVDGMEGMSGQTGFEGRWGTKGKHGKPGIAGRPAPGGKGKPGPKGSTGPIARSGDQGERGQDNFMGGPAGPAGKRGVQGQDGTPGSNGFRGDLGYVGHAGNDGQYCPCPAELDKYVQRQGNRYPTTGFQAEAAAALAQQYSNYVPASQTRKPPTQGPPAGRTTPSRSRPSPATVTPYPQPSRIIEARVFTPDDRSFNRQFVPRSQPVPPEQLPQTQTTIGRTRQPTTKRTTFVTTANTFSPKPTTTTTKRATFHFTSPTTRLTTASRATAPPTTIPTTTTTTATPQDYNYDYNQFSNEAQPPSFAPPDRQRTSKAPRSSPEEPQQPGGVISNNVFWRGLPNVVPTRRYRYVTKPTTVDPSLLVLEQQQRQQQRQQRAEQERREQQRLRQQQQQQQQQAQQQAIQRQQTQDQFESSRSQPPSTRPNAQPQPQPQRPTVVIPPPSRPAPSIPLFFGDNLEGILPGYSDPKPPAQSFAVLPPVPSNKVVSNKAAVPPQPTKTFGFSQDRIPPGFFSEQNDVDLTSDPRRPIVTYHVANPLTIPPFAAALPDTRLNQQRTGIFRQQG